MHAGRVVQFELAASGPWREGLPLPPPIRIAIQRDGGLAPDEGRDQPAVRMIVRPSFDAAFAVLSDGATGLQQHLRIEGDVMLAATVAELAQKLRWDWEEDLSRLVGDVAAHRVGLAMRSIPRGLGELTMRLTRMLSAGVDQAEAPIVGRNEFDFHRQDIDALVARVDALEAVLSGHGSAGPRSS
jgi:ubiquinone biosynthesis protein UbiJ